ncbi:MAG: PepSY-like domain-containing protein [Bacteroidota bacterium]
MKNLALIFCLLASSFVACSNNIPAKNVPSIVVNAFKADFPAADKVEWEKRKGNYEAEFKLDSVEHHAKFTADGRKLMQKKEITEGALPVVINSLLKSQFSNYLTDGIEQVIKDGITYYQVELETKGKPDKKIVFSADGKENSALPYWD